MPMIFVLFGHVRCFVLFFSRASQDPWSWSCFGTGLAEAQNPDGRLGQDGHGREDKEKRKGICPWECLP